MYAKLLTEAFEFTATGGGVIQQVATVLGGNSWPIKTEEHG